MGRPWTEDEINRACAMRRQGMSNSAIARKLNRNLTNVRRRLADRGFPSRQGNQWGLKPAISEPSPRPPTEQEIERQALIAARASQDPISAMLGDPPPGWSALDRMGRGG